MNVQERLKQYLKHKSLTYKQFEQICGLSNGTAARLRETSRESTLNSIANSSDLNISWLMTGEGEMLTQHPMRNEVEDITPEEYDRINAGLRSGQIRMIPLINIDSVGGIHSDNILTPDEQYIIRLLPFTETRPGDVAILQSGNSMAPTIPAGSALLIREVQDWREYFGYGNIYVLWLRDGRRITKEIRRYDPDPQNYVWCVSYNPDVADEELPRSMIRGVWKVVKSLSDFGW